MKNPEPATPRQRERMKELGLENWNDPMTIDEAAIELRTKILDLGVYKTERLPKLPLSAIACSGEGDPVGGRQWER